MLRPMLRCRPAPAPFHRTSRANPTFRGPGSGATSVRDKAQDASPAQGGDPAAGGCNYPSPTPPPANLIGSVNNQANGGFEWACDGALAMIDPVYVYKGPKQPNILTKYPMYHTTTDPVSEGMVPANGYYVPVGSPMDGVVDTNNTYPPVLAACPNFNTAAGVVNNPLLPAPGGQATCPKGLVSPGPTYPAAGGGPFPKGLSSSPPRAPSEAWSIFPTARRLRSSWDRPTFPAVGTARGPATSLRSRRRAPVGTSTFANIFLGCDPRWNGNFGTGQGQLTVNIQENYSLALNTLSATSQAAGLHAGHPRSRVQVGVPAAMGPSTNPFVPAGPIGLNGGFNDFYLPGPFPAVNPLPLFAHLNPNVNTPVNAGCTAQYPAVPPANGGGTCGGTHPFVPPNAQSGPVCSTTTCPLATGNQVMAGTITGPNIFNAGVSINGVTEARFNMSNATKDPHWWVVVGGRGWTAGSIAGALPNNLGPATRAPVIAYIDALTNVERRVHPDLFRLGHHRARRAELRRLRSGERGAKLDASPRRLHRQRCAGCAATRPPATASPPVRDASSCSSSNISVRWAAAPSWAIDRRGGRTIQA